MYTSLYTFKFSPIYADRAFLCLNSMNDLHFFLKSKLDHQSFVKLVMKVLSLAPCMAQDNE